MQKIRQIWAQQQTDLKFDTRQLCSKGFIVTNINEKNILIAIPCKDHKSAANTSCKQNCDFFSSDTPGKALRDALKEGVLPLDRILLESDAPYMIPNAPEKDLDDVCKSLLKRCQPGRNEPCTLPVVAHTVAKCLGVDAEEVARASAENARRVFDLKHPVPAAQLTPQAAKDSE